MLIDASPRRTQRLLFTAIAFLVAMHVALLAGGLPMPEEGSGLRVLFNLDAEKNIPSTYSMLQLLLCVGLLLVLFLEARRERRRRAWHWLALAAIFLFLAADEYFSIHEQLQRPMRQLLGPRNILDFAWVLPYSALVIVFALAFHGFWKDLPDQARRAVAVAALVYVGGALGVETMGSFISRYLGMASPLYALEVIVEETMEMAGIAQFIVALLGLLQQRTGHMTLQFDSDYLDAHRDLMQDIAAVERRKGERRAAG